jgi:hypothetical protein
MPPAQKKTARTSSGKASVKKAPPAMKPAKKAATSSSKASVKKAPPAKKPAAKKPAAKKPTKKSAPAKKPPAKMSPERVLQWSKGSPSTSMDLTFDSDDEEDLMDDAVGYAFLRELQERGHEVRCGYQISKAVFNVVVGKPGGTVVFKAGVHPNFNKDQIVVGQKGKTITAKDFEQACAKMGKIKAKDQTYVLPSVTIYPPALIDVPGISWAVDITYDT